MDHTQALGVTDFLLQTDAITKGAIFILLAMSVATWYLIITKTIHILIARTRSRGFLAMFWNAPSIRAVGDALGDQPPNEPFSHLTSQAIVATRHHAQHGASRLTEAGTAAEFLTRAIRQALDEETARVESGLTLLASVGSTAPFVGLFGTVWGVYHALVNIGMTGQGTLDKVAGPVGEALIMTAMGLAVAIPAVLAYNAITRNNRLLLSQLDSFAHDLFAFLTTGAHVTEPNSIPPLKSAATISLEQN